MIQDEPAPHFASTPESYRGIIRGMQGKPLLIVVTGMPGSGKTTLSNAIANEVRCPLISRDAIKEGVLRTFGLEVAANREVTHQVYKTFFANIELLLRSNVSLVAEAAFQHRVWFPKLSPLQEIADIRIISCAIPTQLANERRMLRAKADPLFNQYHPEPATKRNEPFEALQMDVPTLSVDTTIEPNMQKIKAFLK